MQYNWGLGASTLNVKQARKSVSINFHFINTALFIKDNNVLSCHLIYCFALCTSTLLQFNPGMPRFISEICSHCSHNSHLSLTDHTELFASSLRLAGFLMSLSRIVTICANFGLSLRPFSQQSSMSWCNTTGQSIGAGRR